MSTKDERDKRRDELKAHVEKIETRAGQQDKAKFAQLRKDIEKGRGR